MLPSWAEGFSRLGFTVYLVEQIAPEACVDESGAAASFEQSMNRAYFRDVVERFGFSGRAALLYGEGEAGEGTSRRHAIDLARSAELLVNISGHLPDGPLRLPPQGLRGHRPGLHPVLARRRDAPAREPRRLLHHRRGHRRRRLRDPGRRHRVADGPSRVVLDRWPVTAAPNSCRFTTVASWRGAYGRVKFGGRSYGLKAHEFRKVIDLPRTTPSSSCWTIRPGSSRREGRAVAGAVASLVVNVSRTPAAPPQESECGGSH